MSVSDPPTANPGILERIAAGDAAAVQDCIDTYGNLVWALANRFLRTHADAEDIVQEIFIELWNSAHRFDPRQGTEITFVATIARRRLIDRVRQRDRSPGIDSLDCEELAETSRPVVLPRLEEDSDVARVGRVLSGMDEQQREILSLALYEGFTHSEIAERLDLPLGTVKTKVRRGLIHVREQLGIPPSGDD